MHIGTHILVISLLAGAVVDSWARGEWVSDGRRTRGFTIVTQPKHSNSLKADFSQILHHRADKLTIFRMVQNPHIYVFDYPTLRSQGLALNRIAGLIEKQDLPGDRVMKQSELDAYFASKKVNPDTFYFGHNYKGEDLAEFFNLVHRDGLQLNQDEAEFLHQLLEHGVLIKQRKMYKVADPPIVVLSISQPQQDNPETEELDFVVLPMRCTVLRHELSHGEYSTNAFYRRFVRDFWRRTMNEEDRKAFRRFLNTKGYDDRDDELMANEMQAYLMHSPNHRAFSPQRVGLTAQRVDELRSRFLQDSPESWTIDYFYPPGGVEGRRKIDLNCSFY